MNLLNKIIIWIRVNLATVIGVTQAALKAIKEILTGIINLISIFISVSAAQKIVERIRNIVNWFDELIEEWKEKLLKVIL